MKLEESHQIRQSKGMPVIGTLAAGVAHEFNNILTGMMGYASLAQMDEKYIPELVATVLTLCERGGQLIQSLSAFSQRNQEYKIDNTIYIKFTDTGCGIKEEHLGRIFEPFFTTKGSLGGGLMGSLGSGLGLSESYNIIKEHGGDIQVESEVGIGTTFTIQLPIRGEKDLEIDREKTVPCGGEGKHVLVVDDESHVCEILKATLRHSRYNVVTANSGEAALAEVQSGKFNYIFLDLLMPGRLDGLATFDEIKKVDAEANIIITTGQLLEDIPEKYLSRAYNILTKPFSIGQIHKSIRAYSKSSVIQKVII